jgi:hypothetical protein
VHHHGAETPDGKKDHVELKGPVESILVILEKPEDYEKDIENARNGRYDGGDIDYHAGSFLLPNFCSSYYYTDII